MNMTIRPKEAWDMLQDAGIIISMEKLKQGIRHGVWAWADYIAAEDDTQKEVYIIYMMPFRRWLAERSPYAPRPDEEAETTAGQEVKPRE